MLTALRIRGFAVVDHAEVEFGPGLNVLTGETGAGKSIVLEALHLVQGGRMSGEVLREGADEASVEALFELARGHPVLSRLGAAGLDVPQEGEVLVRRSVTRAGRGRAFVNGSLSTVSTLETALRGLVDVTSQHGQVALLDEATHLGLLDAYAQSQSGLFGEDAPSLASRYREAYRSFASLTAERAALLAASLERSQRADYLSYQLGEIDGVGPRPGEDEELERERQVLKGAAKLQEAARKAEALIDGGEASASERLGSAVRVLTEASALDTRIEPILALIRSARAEVDEAGRALARYADQVEGDPQRLLALDDRLGALRALARKHGGGLALVVSRAEAMREELRGLRDGDERARDLDAEVARAGELAAALARELGELRARAAKALGREVKRALSALAMERCRLEVAFSPPEHGVAFGGLVLGPDGAERACILIGPNPGEPARPLARIASGGELSRVLLATKRALASADPVDAYVLDEVDAGLGGGAAEAVGRLLSEVARERQVICVTHLPQVAAFADRHLKVLKRVKRGRTLTEVVPLEEDERRQEVARMLAGQSITASAVAHAGELIARAALAGRRLVPARSAARRVEAPS
ncbi:MAG TPA: DNA repair protein RecN [Anaeromyxobacteraceae bacterium]|nr:DNA repair protein RecN [Anaeromyxobacteraceae bacterium]